MVSVKKLECEYPYVKSNTTEQRKCHQMPPRGIKAHIYQFGALAHGNGSCFGLSSNAEEEQNLLDVFLLSQWEDHSSNGQMAYDITMCETKIVNGGKQFIAQLNKNWSTKFFAEFENNALQPLGPFKPSYMKTLRENLLFCVATGEKDLSELVPSAMLPKDGTLVIMNVNPVEYGHVFLVPYDYHQRPQFLDKRRLQLVTQIAAEVKSCSFRISYEHNVSAHSGHIYFQAAYFANPLPVEFFPTVSVYGDGFDKGISICEIADYPLKALLFTSKNLQLLVGVVAEICSDLQKDKNTVFSLVVSDSGTKMFLFPQVHLPASGSHLSAWECAGYFIYKTASEFDGASEMELSKRMASVSLGNENFQALKQLSCSIAMKHI